MKKYKLLFLVVGFFVLYGCSTNSDVNSVPQAPTNLVGVAISPTQIKFTWNDNSTNETEFIIEVGSPSGGFIGIVAATVPGTETTGLFSYTLSSGVSPNYVSAYRVKARNAEGYSYISNEVIVSTDEQQFFATLTTTTLSNITSSGATSGGNIISDGGSAVTARGVVWSTNPNPTIALSTKTSDGAGLGLFTSTITGWIANTNYYVRAYATNSQGTAYGNQFVTTKNIPGPDMTDLDGNVYLSVTNGNQTWTKKNLNVSKYSDGTPIPQVTNATQWGNLTTGAWCYYNNTTANGITYGKLYNWYAVAGIYNSASLTNPNLRKKLAPIGWHVPTEDEWRLLTNCYSDVWFDTNTINNGYYTDIPKVGGKMKSTGNTLWQIPNTLATNESGFTGFPGGYIWTSGFENIGTAGYWWSSTETTDTKNPFYRSLRYETGDVSCGSIVGKNNGFSVRCVKD